MASLGVFIASYGVLAGGPIWDLAGIDGGAEGDKQGLLVMLTGVDAAARE